MKSESLQRAPWAWRHLVGAAMCSSLLAPALADDLSWKKIDPGPVLGMDLKVHTAACSGFPGTNSKFSFWSKRGRSSNLVVYFEGGGACWDNFTCTFPMAAGFPAPPQLPPQLPQLFMPAIPTATDPSKFDGIFKTDSAANPVKDWNFVYIPYCTGDVHIGSATRNYVAAPPNPFRLPTPFEIDHQGYDNFMVVLDWMRQHVDQPERVLVAGVSAGGYGAGTHFPWIRHAYPTARLAVLADGSQGVTTPAFDKGTPGRGSWNPQLPPWVFGTDATQVQSRDILRRNAAVYPFTRVAQFTTKCDLTQTAFYGLMKYPPGQAPATVGKEWNEQMVDTARSYEKTPNYRHYIANGYDHTILGSGRFYTESSGGVKFTDWLSAMVGRDDDSVAEWVVGTLWNSTWRNAACPGCLQAAPCPRS